MTLILATRKQYAKRSADIMAYASTSGLQRERALAGFKLVGDKPAFSIAFGRELATITGKGEVHQAERISKVDMSDVDKDDHDYEAIYIQRWAALRARNADLEEASSLSYVNPVFASDLVPGSVGLNKIVEGIPIFCGVCVIIAGSGVGKTPLAHALAAWGYDDDKSYVTVPVGEPFAGYTSNNAVAASSMGRACVLATDVVVDSIKDLLGSGGGGLTKGGISRAALSLLSHWSAVGAATGCTFYIPLNPSTGDDDTFKLLLEAARSSATTTIHDDNGVWKYSARPGEGVSRIEGSLPKGIMSSLAATGRAMINNGYNRDSDSNRALVPNSITSEVFAGIVQRSTIAKA